MTSGAIAPLLAASQVVYNYHDLLQGGGIGEVQRSSGGWQHGRGQPPVVGWLVPVRSVAFGTTIYIMVLTV